MPSLRLCSVLLLQCASVWFMICSVVGNNSGMSWSMNHINVPVAKLPLLLILLPPPITWCIKVLCSSKRNLKLWDTVSSSPGRTVQLPKMYGRYTDWMFPDAYINFHPLGGKKYLNTCIWNDPNFNKTSENVSFKSMIHLLGVKILVAKHVKNHEGVRLLELV